MRTIRRLATTAAALSLTAAGFLGAAAPQAQAAGPVSPNTAGAHTYAFSLAAENSTTSTGTMAWNNTTFALTVTAKTGQLKAGSCVTVYFDWNAKGHHDARALRDCVSNDTYSYSFTDSNTSNLTGGPNRMGLCYGTDDTIGTCTYYTVVTPATVPMNWNPWPRPNDSQPCTLSFTKKASTGTISTFIDAHAQRRVLVGSTC